MKNADDNIQDSDEAQISGLLRSLKRVEAPGDFGFRVKARMASARPSTGRSSWLPASAAVAAPLGLVLAVGGYFTLTTLYSPATVSPPAVADIRPAELPPLDVIDSTFVAESGPVVAVIEPNTDQPVNPIEQRPHEVDSSMVARPSVKRTISHLPSSDSGRGSYEITSGIVKEIPPAGSVPNRRNGMDPTAAGVNGSVPAKDVLSAMGVDATNSGRAWTVGGVRKGSSAERSGLKPGDVIEAVNGQTLSGSTSFKGKFTGKSVVVRRDGKPIQIDLKP